MDEEKKIDENLQEVQERSYDEILVDWIDGTGHDKTIKAYIYKYSLTGARESVGIFENDDIPNQDDLGKMCGGGKYLVILKWRDDKKKKHAKTINLVLHERYNEIYESLKPTGGVSAQLQQMQQMQQMQQQPTNTPFDYEKLTSFLGNIFTVVSPFLLKMLDKPQQDGNNSPVIPDMTGYMETIGKMNTSMSNMMLENFITMREKMSEITYSEDEVEEKTNTVDTLIEQFGPLLNGVLEKLAPKEKIPKITVAMLKQVPAVKRLMKDKMQLSKVLSYIEKEQGKDALKKVKESFGIK